ncbi:prepilin-type N-terminal cleavage/methylation domain-containing protein [Vibrio astriarenae]|uniref:Prepilin-type N-terminal cleavage/methylation domain-containing protein n=1 Tax=Vibrio astriarenae TaxID=1481923 RepID=A0A7Z2YEG1_9VIBR|nr:prepilin-type N-terminal cleavage/methylation domain-containing protein [Vibrio astriarenae]QIA64306.1 prepilin-type N-terminal cleavage/methylation domain-containing protein [Vibrio astriarenae]
MKRQGGFTLIELVVVIVILGILAVTAAPKFLNLQEDARKSSLQGLKGAMTGAAGIVYGKAAINGVERESDDSVEGIATVYGYPSATSAGIALAVTGLSEDWSGFESTSGAVNTYVVTFKDDSLDAGTVESGNCFVYYQQATSTAVGTEANAFVVDSGC